MMRARALEASDTEWPEGGDVSVCALRKLKFRGVGWVCRNSFHSIPAQSGRIISMQMSSLKTPGIFILLLGCFGPVATVQAGTWVLANGDHLTGELVQEDAQFIEVQHPQLGRLRLSRAALRTDEAAKAKPAEQKAEVARQAPAEAKPAVKPDEASKWKRQIEVGYTQQSGAKDKQDLVIRGQFDGHDGPDTFRAIGRLLHSEASGKIVTERREGDFRWRHDVNKRWFAQSLTNYEEDDVRNIDLNLEQQLGGGYRMVDTARHKASVGFGAVVQYLQRKEYNDQTALLGSFFQDYTYQLNSRLKLVQEASFMVSDKGTLNLKSGLANTTADGSYRLKFNTGVQSKVTDHMSLNVRFEYDYDRSVIDSDLRADQRLTTSLGYLW